MGPELPPSLPSRGTFSEGPDAPTRLVKSPLAVPEPCPCSLNLGGKGQHCCASRSSASHERAEATCPDHCPMGFPTGQAASKASEAESHGVNPQRQTLSARSKAPSHQGGSTAFRSASPGQWLQGVLAGKWRQRVTGWGSWR